MGMNNSAPLAWETLFAHALELIGEIEKHGMPDPFWTFGGGTVLMLRYNHRYSKDVDIFVPDPQSLGYVNPRLSEVAERITTEYAEANSYVKLFLPQGEIDFVAASNLTSPGYEFQTILGTQVRVETSAEIIAKKLWHRGHAITGRDIFDFALIAEKEPDSLMRDGQFMMKHAATIRAHLVERSTPLRKQFEAVEAIDFHPDFQAACDTLIGMLEAIEDRLVRRK
ncbi:MAG: nucleotidyl transferase AbiEii/AbiGii toxin family protein [Burkholderiales bacterium]|nr:nucleotidyl transferase AbiEii/AbiGii toxin family protein [Burkholderiales bacterium]